MTQVLGEPITTRTVKPRLGFLGVGWIGRHRMKALAGANAGEVVAIWDPSPEAMEKAAQDAPLATCARSYEHLLQADLDAVVIATPSAMHAAQAVAALDRGLAVFCQKPLARSGPETKQVVDTARRVDRLLGIDFSYRFTSAFSRILSLIRAGQLGEIYAIDVAFHNAYGPDKPWFKDPELSGGGCVIDLGVHLIDLALLALDQPRIAEVSSRLFARGAPLADPAARVEDYATADVRTVAGASIRLACSWWLHAGREAVISAEFRGTKAGAALSNVNGSFYEFRAEHFRGTRSEAIAEPPDDWGGRAIIDWAHRLAGSRAFDPGVESAVDVANVVDRIYGR